MKRICFYSEKARVGKSTLTLIMAMIMKDKYNLKVTIVDTTGDLLKQREEELTFLRNNPQWRDRIENSVPMIKQEAWEDYQEQEKELDVDLVLFDVSDIGSTQIDFLLNSNYIFLISDVSPSDSKNFQIGVEEYRIFQDIRYSIIPFEKAFMVFNKTSDKGIEDVQKDIDIVQPCIKEREFLKREHISTMAYNGGYDSIQSFANEIYKIVFEHQQQYYQ